MPLKAFLVSVWDSVRSSYWFYPVLFCIGALLLSIWLPVLDAAVREQQLPEWARTTTDAARSVLATIAASMIGVTGTVFSITIVTLSLASQQFGPRLLRTFMDNAVTQLTLAVFIGTGLYSLLILRIVEEIPRTAEPPNISVLFAITLAVVSLFVLIAFIHHIALQIQAPVVIERVTADLNGALERHFPDREEEDEASVEEQREDVDWKGEIYSTREGYIQAIDYEALAALAREKEILFALKKKPGDFITTRSLLACQSGTGDEDEISERLSQSFIVGSRRTPRQDFECAVSELVEVAVRALSPGINDPFTAVNCVDRLGAVLAKLARRPPQRSRRYDSDEELRLFVETLDFPAVLNTAFHQIRQYSGGAVAVLIRLLESMQLIAHSIEREEDRVALARHAEMVWRTADCIPEKSDRADLKRRMKSIRKILQIEEQPG